MKKHLILLLLACLGAYHSFSQRSGFLNLSLGGAIPIGEYGSKNNNDPKSGIANPGGVVDLSYGHVIGQSPFGLTATLRGRINPIDGTADVSSLSATYPDYKWSEKKVSWKSAALMVGAYYYRPLTKKLQFQLALLAGAGENQLPNYSITGLKSDPSPANESEIIVSTKKVNAVAFSALAKTGVTYQLTDRLFLTGHVAFWYMKPTFKNVTVTEIEADGFVIPGNLSPSNAQSISYNQTSFNYTQPMNSLDISIGIGITL